MRAYREQLERVFAEYGATWEGVARSIEGYFTHALENPELYQLLFERPVPGFVPSAAGMAESQKLLDLSERLAAQAIASGTFHTESTPAEVANLLIALMHGFTALHLANEPELPVGSGRFGSLIPALIELLQCKWA
jgi:hypothetical protein